MKTLKDIERRLAESVLARDAVRPLFDQASRGPLSDLDRLPEPGRTSGFYAVPERAVPGHSRVVGGNARSAGNAGAFLGRAADAVPPADEDRTSVLINRGRGSAYRPGFFRRHKVIAALSAALLALTVGLVTVLLTGGASWPASVPTMQAEITTACQNPDVTSEPGQINFACAKGTQQILWVFALLASSGNPQFSDTKGGRMGLEPIAPAQGAEVAWSLNLHHPYNAMDPIDSLEVAARAINNIIGGASTIGANGDPSVQPGLESEPASCMRYTGSAAVTSEPGFPSVCRAPVMTAAQQSALVADVYQKWAVGATAQDAQDAAILFENAGNPGNPQVQAILKNMSQTNL
jgi:hypothetical protein